MSRKTLVHTGAAIGLSVLLALGASPAEAANSDGAQVVKLTGCTDVGDATICNTAHVETNIVSTPQNEVVEFNGRFDYTVTFTDGSISTGTGSGHAHFLFSQGQQVEFSYHDTESYTSTAFGDCSFSYDIHYVNGQYQFNNFINHC